MFTYTLQKVLYFAAFLIYTKSSVAIRHRIALIFFDRSKTKRIESRYKQHGIKRVSLNCLAIQKEEIQSNLTGSYLFIQHYNTL